ncbi:hypothetical protein AUQ39_02535 [Lacticaseibacillus casei]|nr:hypothetical protein AUQ39_02535 [Lacticaseibacillus casei]
MKVTSVKRVHQSDWRKEGVPFLRARDIIAFNKGQKIKEPIYISESQYEKYVKQSGRVTPGDLLVTGVGSIGVPFVVKAKTPLYFKDGNIIWFQNKTLDPDFLFYQFTSASVQSFVMSSSGKGTVGTFTISSGKRTPIVFPVMSEQRRIGMTLRNISNLIAATQGKFDQLQMVKKALLQHLFDQSMRFKGYSDPWEKRKLGELLTLLKDGTHGTHKKGCFAFLLSAKNVTRNKLHFDDTDRKISKKDFDEIYANYHLVQNDILVTIVGTIGRVALFPKLNVPIAFQRSVAILRPKNLLSPGFLALELQTHSVQYQLSASSNMSAQAGIYLGDLKRIIIAIPESQEQDDIANTLFHLNDLIAATQSKLSSLESLKKPCYKDFSFEWERLTR